MKELAQNLLKTVDGAVQLYEKLRLVLEHKQTAIVEGKTDELTQCTATEERLIELARVLNDNRTGLLRSLAVRLGFAGQAPTFQQVAERIGEPYCATLREQKAKLTKLIESVGEINRTNALLLQDSLGFINDVLRSAFGAPKSSLVYGQHGTLDPVRVERALVNLQA